MRVIVEMQIPADKISTMLHCQPTMNVEMIFQMAEISFQRIGGRWDCRIAQAVKHVWQGADQKVSHPANHFVFVPISSAV